MSNEYRQSKIAGMREMLNFLEANENVELPYFGVFTGFPLEDQVKAMARAMKPAAKEYSSYYFSLRKKFEGGITLDMSWARDNVCERIVTGTREVAEEVIPERVIEAHTEEIVEWACPDAVLAPSDEEVVSENS